MADLIPPKRGEFFTPNGIPTQRFITWIENLTTQTNESTGSITTIEIAEKYPWPVGREDENAADFVYPAIPQEQVYFKAITVNSDHTATPYDFINAKSNAAITFPKYPNENSVIIIRNGDGSTVKLYGNGKNINGSSTGVLNRKGTSIEFHYFLESDEWFAK